jgi:hypothetical protein
MTSLKQTSLFTEAELTSSQEASLASHTAWPESGKERQMSAICGPKCLGQFERYNRAGSWAKTFSALLIGTGGWYSRRCKLTWKVKGTKYNRMYFQLAPSTLPTDGTGFGLLLKTPCAADGYTENMSKKEQKFGNSGTLAQEVQTGFIYQRGMLPTPTAVQREHPERVAALKEAGAKTMMSRVNGKERPNSILDALMFQGLLPTPMSQDGQNSTAPASQAGRDTLPGMVAATGTTSQLNPRFVLEMMGFPPNWTELPFQNGETNP